MDTPTSTRSRCMDYGNRAYKNVSTDWIDVAPTDWKNTGVPAQLIAGAFKQDETSDCRTSENDSGTGSRSVTEFGVWVLNGYRPDFDSQRWEESIKSTEEAWLLPPYFVLRKVIGSSHAKVAHHCNWYLSAKKWESVHCGKAVVHIRTQHTLYQKASELNKTVSQLFCSTNAVFGSLSYYLECSNTKVYEHLWWKLRISDCFSRNSLRQLFVNTNIGTLFRHLRRYYKYIGGYLFVLPISHHAMYEDNYATATMGSYFRLAKICG